MIFRNWTSLLKEGLVRGRRRAALSGLGIMAGVAALVYFMALGKGVRETVLGRLIKDLPAEEIQVIPQSMTLGPIKMERPNLFSGAKILDDDTVQKLKRLTITVDGGEVKAVKKVYRQLDASFPASITGDMFGISYGTDTAISGVDPEMVADDARGAKFRYDPDAEETPVLIPFALLEVYNSAFARAQGLPQLSESFLMGKHFTIRLGASSISRAGGKRVIVKRGVIVGLTERGALLGVTAPIEYVQDWNRAINPDEKWSYRMLTVVAEKPEYVPAIAAAVRDMGFDARASSGLAERVGAIITMITGGLSLVAGVILFVAGLNAFSLFRLSALERRREVGLMMALGATRREVRSLVLAEALAVGFIGGCSGVMAAMAAGWGTNSILRSAVDIPFLPEKLLCFSAATLLPGLGLAVGLALAAAWPAARALSKLNPADIL